jgi:hypothetical protein
MEGERKKLGVRDEGGERGKKKKFQDGCPRGGRFFFFYDFKRKKKFTSQYFLFNVDSRFFNTNLIN